MIYLFYLPNLICGAIGNFKGRLKIGFQTALAFQCLFRLLRNIALYGICAVAEEVLFHLLGEVFARARIGKA